MGGVKTGPLRKKNKTKKVPMALKLEGRETASLCKCTKTPGQFEVIIRVFFLCGSDIPEVVHYLKLLYLIQLINNLLLFKEKLYLYIKTYINIKEQ